MAQEGRTRPPATPGALPVGTRAPGARRSAWTPGRMAGLRRTAGRSRGETAQRNAPPPPPLRCRPPVTVRSPGGHHHAMRERRGATGFRGPGRSRELHCYCGFSYSPIRLARAIAWNRRLKPTTAGDTSPSGPSFSWSTAYTVNTYRWGPSPGGGAAPPKSLLP